MALRTQAIRKIVTFFNTSEHFELLSFPRANLVCVYILLPANDKEEKIHISVQIIPFPFT